MNHGSLFHVDGRGEAREFLLEQDQVVIGRSPDCDVVISEEAVSRRHALISCGEECFIRDLGSANGTIVDGAAVRGEPLRLRDGSLLKIGSSSFRYVRPPGHAGTEGIDAAGMASESDRANEATTAARLETALETGTLAQALLEEPTGVVGSESVRAAVVSVLLSNREEPRILLSEHGRTRSFDLGSRERWTIGRGSGCDIILETVLASRQHARIDKVEGGFHLLDLGSRNGALVNGVELRERLLVEGDTIRIGEAVLTFRSPRRAQGISGGRRATTPIHPVVVVPGLGGTELYKGATKMWPNLMRLASCSRDVLPEYWGDLRPGRVVRELVVLPGFIRLEAFGRLIEFLCEGLGYGEGKDLLEFGYDWRQDNRSSARLLKERVTAWRRELPDPQAKIVFIAHSMGGLVCRYFLEHEGGADACHRLILLGTPSRGSASIFRTLLEGRTPSSVPFATDKIRELVRHFPSAYQLLPRYSSIKEQGGAAFDPISDDGWLPRELRPHLAAGKPFITALLSTEGAPLPTTCVFGYGQRTLSELFVRRGGDGGLTVVKESFDDIGDEAVAEESAVLARAEIHPVCQKHGALHADKDVQRRLRYELTERGV